MQTDPVSLLFSSASSPTVVVTGTLSATTGNQPAFTAAGAVSSADFVSGAPLTPGSFSTIFGQNLARTATATIYPPPLTLGGTSVTINGVPAPLFYAGSGQINFFVPYELAGQTNATIVVSSAAGVAEVAGILIAPESPGLYLEDAAGHASAVHLNGQPLTPVITIGGMNTQVMFAGPAPGFAGLYQLNAIASAGLPSVKPNEFTGFSGYGPLPVCGSARPEQ